MTPPKEREAIFVAILFILLAFVVTRQAPGGEAGERLFALGARLIFLPSLFFYAFSWRDFFWGFLATGVSGICLLATTIHPLIGPENTLVVSVGAALFIVINSVHLYRFAGRYCAVAATTFTGRINEA